MLDDEPLLSPRRLLGAVRQRLFYQTRDPVVEVSFWQLLRYHHRPWASSRDGVY